jgi:TonB family protein
MRSPGFITRNRKSKHALVGWLFPILLWPLIIVGSADGQHVAVIAPDGTKSSLRAAESIGDSLSNKLAIVDASLANTAFASADIENPFNLSLEEAKRAGAAIGAEAFILVRAETLRRSSTTRPAYYESYSVVFLVNSRSGHLVWWTLVNAEANTSAISELHLDDSMQTVTANISANCLEWLKSDNLRKTAPDLPEMPADGSPEAKTLRAPIPYRRLKPEYTRQAFLYGAKGTVEILVDLDEKGNILATEIERWAGFGLDESVTDTVRKMSWRPAERGGKPLPMRFLLRYNFKKIEKE